MASLFLRLLSRVVGVKHDMVALLEARVSPDDINIRILDF